MAEENQIGLKGLLRNFTGAASDKEVEFLKTRYQLEKNYLLF